MKIASFSCIECTYNSQLYSQPCLFSNFVVIFTTTTLRQGFFNSNQPEDHTKEKESGMKDSGGKKTGHIHSFYIGTLVINREASF